MDDVIVVKDLTKRFGHFVAVDNISFNVKKGEIFGFLGANGGLKQNTPLDISSYDKIIIGTPIYAGNSSKKVKKFIVANLNHLQKKEIGLYVCGMEKEEEKQREELEGAYPTELLERAKAKQFLGGEFMFENMNFFERMIIKKIAKIDKSISALNHQNIDRFIQDISL